MNFFLGFTTVEEAYNKIHTQLTQDAEITVIADASSTLSTDAAAFYIRDDPTKPLSPLEEEIRSQNGSWSVLPVDGPDLGRRHFVGCINTNSGVSDGGDDSKSVLHAIYEEPEEPYSDFSNNTSHVC
jgi:hypothetical protein